MKKFIITTSCCLICLLSNTNTFAQYKFFIGGTLQFSSSTITHHDSGDSQNTSNYTILPYIGATISDKIIVGLGLGYKGYFKKGNNDNDSRIKSHALIINPFTRYRVALSDKMGLYGELGGNIDLSTSQYIQATRETNSKASRFGIYLGPGIDYTLSDRWMVTGNWSVLNYRISKNMDYTGHDFRLNFNPRDVRISLNYLF